MLDALPIDQALFEAAMIATPPAIVRPFVDNSASQDTFLATNEARLQTMMQDVAGFVARGEAMRHTLRTSFESNEIKPHHLAMLGVMIDALESRAAKLSDEYTSMHRASASMYAQLEPHFPPAKRKTLRSIKEGVLKGTRREVDEYSDMALFLRALKAEFEPQEVGGRSFTDKKDLARYLSDVLA